MELHPVELALVVGDRRERRAVRGGHGAKAGRQPGDAVAVAHPHRRARSGLPHIAEERRVGDDLKLGAAEFARMSALDGAAKRGDHRLLAVANAEHGDAGVDQRRRELRGAGLMHGGWAAGEDDGLGQDRRERRFRLIEGHDLGIDAGLAHAAGNELSVLRAEIDDEDLIVCRHGAG